MKIIYALYNKLFRKSAMAINVVQINALTVNGDPCKVSYTQISKSFKNYCQKKDPYWDFEYELKNDKMIGRNVRYKFTLSLINFILSVEDLDFDGCTIDDSCELTWRYELVNSILKVRVRHLKLEENYA